MKLIDDIQKNQIDVLSQMGLTIKKIKVTHSSENSIVYKIFLDNSYVSIFYNWEQQKVTFQFFLANEYKKISKECSNLNNLHSIVINEIFSNL